MYISPKYQELFGYTPEERQAHPNLWRELLHPEDRERVILAEEQADDERAFSADYRMVSRDRQGRVGSRRDGARSTMRRVSRSSTKA